MSKDEIETKSEITPEKVGEALNAANEAKETSKEVLKSQKESKEDMTSLVGAIKELVEKSAKPSDEKEVAELKSKVALLEAKSKADNSGSSTSNKSDEMVTKSKDFLEGFQASLRGKSSKTHESDSLFGNCGTFAVKSLKTFDNTGVGADIPAKRVLGDLDINLQTISPITSLVANVSAGNTVAGELGYKTYDESDTDILQSRENEGKVETKDIKKGEINIYLTQYAAKKKISDKVLHAEISGELSTNPLMREFMAIETKFEKYIAREILNGKNEMGIYGILPSAKETNTRMKVIESETDNVVTLKDLANLGLNLKGQYLRNAAFVVDRAILYELFQEDGNDGHLKLEQWDYVNGFAAIKTPERTIPLIGVDSSYFADDIKSNDGFADYVGLDGDDTPITAGYTPSSYADVTGATDNQGKAVAILADFNQAYTLARSSIVQTGVDNSFGNLLENGYVYGGKIGYVGGKPTVEEAASVLFVK